MTPQPRPVAAHGEIPLRHRDRARLARGEVVFGAASGTLFAESPLPTDARQGVIGDCYLLSAFSALARAAPERLQALLRANGDGTFRARFFRRLDGGGFAPEEVVVDARIPLRASDGVPLYARSARPGELWPLIAEKAYAAWKGGYDVAGEGGMVERTLEELTGEPTRMLFTAETRPESLWQLLERATREGWPAAVCTYGRHERPAIDELGFHPNHILIFLGVHTWMGRRIVWLRDPFDTPACGSMVKPDPRGVYTLGWDDFLAYFAEVELNGAAACAVELPPYPARTIGEAIEHAYVFSPLDAAEQRRLAAGFTRVRVGAGELIARAGQPADHFHLLQHGAAVVELPTGRGQRVTRVAVLHAGDQFGEIHLLDGRAYDASLRALTPVALYRMPAAALRRWVERHPELGRRFRRRWDLQLTMLEWGRHQVTTVNADTLLAAGTQQVHRKGKVIFAAGDQADGVFVIVSGRVEVQAAAAGRRRRLETLGPGQVFGEVEVLRRSPRVATATARSRVTLLKLDLGSAAQVMERFDILQRQLQALADRRERKRLGLERHR